MKKLVKSGLSDEAATLHRDLAKDYGITDSGGLLLLQTACEAFDRMRQAQEIIAKHGAVVPDRNGQLKTNPAAGIERDARAAMLSALKALHLDLEPVQPVGRPAGKFFRGV